MDLIVVERSFLEPVTVEELQVKEHAAAWCLSINGVRFLRTYVSNDGKRMLCLYEAPDAEAVRRTQETAGLPFDRIWTATEMAPPPA